jgi:large subunit ribosomal protein L35
MPKNKTHSGTKKRFRVTKNGKIFHEHTNNVHKFHEKTGSENRRVAKDQEVSKADRPLIKKLLGI